MKNSYTNWKERRNKTGGMIGRKGEVGREGRRDNTSKAGQIRKDPNNDTAHLNL